MTQRINVTVFGFVIGIFTYYWKKKSLYRYNHRSGSILLLKLQLYGGSLGYFIQKKLYKMNDLKKLTTKVVITEILPF